MAIEGAIETTLATALAVLGGAPPRQVERLRSNWHGDAHWRVMTAAGAEVSLRVIRTGRPRRWEEDRDLDPGTVARQIATMGALADGGLPFMRVVGGPVVAGSDVVVAFAWMAGSPVATPRADEARAMGTLLSAVHRAGRQLDPAGLPRHRLAAMAARSLAELDGLVPAPFLRRATEVAAALPPVQAQGIASHGDLNQPNVLWRGPVPVGVVDLDQVGDVLPEEELAWVVKWWSRPEGIGSGGHERGLADAVIAGYGAPVDGTRLAPMLWAAGGLNANAVLAIRGTERPSRPAVVERVRRRAEQLVALVG